jgi:predicted nucleotidyltransferase
MNISSLETDIREKMIGTGSLVSIPVLTPLFLQEIIRRIVDAVDPAKIILFGSYAYGTPHNDSDIDILVIMETDRPRHKRPIAINRALAGLLIPKDILVYTPAEIDDWKDVPQAFVTQVIKKGVVVYDKDKERFDPGLV